MTYKRYACALLALAIVLAVATIAFWHSFTRPTFYEKDGHGDLARLASYDIPRPIATPPVDLGGTHEMLGDYFARGDTGTRDILVIGDSVSGGAGGSWWQDDLQARYGIETTTALRMLHGSDYTDVYQMARLLLALGYIDQLRPRCLVLECGERMITRHFASDIRPLPDWTRDHFEREVRAYRETTGRDIVPPYTLLSTTMGAANKAYIENRLHERFVDGQPTGDARHARLTIPTFSNPGWQHDLVYFVQDKEYLTMPHETAAVNATLNDLAADLRAHGTELVLFVLPDKLDTYYPWLEDQSFPPSPFFDEMAALPHDYAYIDTRTPLRQAVAAGTPDLYWCDDTHASYRAQRLLVDLLAPVLSK